MNRRGFLGLAAMVLLLFGMSGVLWALCPEDYNRPVPLMDYVPQEIGIYDTTYQALNEADCRDCHGGSLVVRHHNTEIALRDHLCSPCHEVIPEPPEFVIIRDCLTSGCHSWDDAGPMDGQGTPPNGWHHTTDMSASENCIFCHNPNLIDEVTTYPLADAVPTPFSCGNCHWEQAHSVTGDPDNPGHPSTYDHYDVLGQFVGFHEYSNPISGPFDTHHMGEKGYGAGQCDKCHGADPRVRPPWDPYNPKLIRYCQTCHGVGSLHRIGPHVQDTNSWEAVGFHVAGHPGENSCDDYDPIVYRTWDPTTPYTPQTYPGFTADEQCIGCHGEYPTEPPPSAPCKPAIATNSEGIQPNGGSCGLIVTLRGECFGQEHRCTTGSSVQLKKKPDGDTWIDMPIHSWTDSMIEFEIPCWTFAEGNYWVRVKTPGGTSNVKVFSKEDE